VPMEGLLRPIALFLCALTVPSLTVDPVRPLEQPRVANWNQQNGLLQDTTNALAQTPDGFLWVASDESLVRFDGIEFFVPGEFQKKPLLQRMARSLWTDADGQLWIGSYGRVYCRVRKGSFRPFDQTAGAPSSEILAIATDSEGTRYGLGHIKLVYIGKTVIALPSTPRHRRCASNASTAFAQGCQAILGSRHQTGYTESISERGASRKSRRAAPFPISRPPQ
jgi:ligand-binding sensor domain-containing protein